MSESENKLIVDKIKQLEIENKELRACHESELGVCFQHCEEVKQLQAENERLKELLVQERIPNFCTGVECGCAERVAEARKKAKIRLRKELETELSKP